MLDYPEENGLQGTSENVMPINDKSEGGSKFRIALAKTVTTWALVAILAIATLIIVVAGINAIRVTEKEQRDQFFDIAKYVFGVLLPVIGAWIGTVLAFYFGQVNFEVASRSAATCVSSHRAKNSKPSLSLAPDATLADAKDLLDKIPNVSISWLHKTELRMA